MKNYLFKRILQGIGVIFAISLITFFILNIIPGNPVRMMLGEFATEEAVTQVTKQMGLDRPTYIQYFDWLKNMLSGNFGVSYFQKKDVLSLMIPAFKVTLNLAIMAYVLAVISGVVFGVLAAINHKKWGDSLIMTISVFGISAPVFWIAIILQVWICLIWNILPISGSDSFINYILPAIALGMRYAAGIARITRTSMLEVMNQDYIRTAKAKGLVKWTVIIRHGLRNALIPIITVSGTELGNILTGSILIESIFSMPGMGKLLLDAINTRDLPIVQGGVMYIAFVCVVVFLLVDILYALVDPRVRLGKESE